MPHAHAEFKRVRGLWRRDILRYGWQRRQDRGKKVATDGKVGSKSGKDVRGRGRIHVTVPTAVMGSDCHAGLSIALFSRPWRRVARVDRTKIPQSERHVKAKAAMIRSQELNRFMCSRGV